jgi:alkylation response protein AidB-like acyl-CoA dehydrogenase
MAELDLMAVRVPPSALGASLPQVPDDHPFRLEFREWLAGNTPPSPSAMTEAEDFAFRVKWQKALYEGGWAGPAWPVRYGGRGSGALEQFMYYEELALVQAPRVTNESGILLLGPTLMLHGTEEQKRRFLPGILSGDDIWCQGFSEPDSGSDLASLRTTARLTSEGWVITGQKIWTTWAAYSKWCFVLCRTEDPPRHKGLSMLILDMDQPGVQVRPIRQMSGKADFCEVFFDDARTPHDMIVGERGQGWQVAMTMLQFERSDQGYTDHAPMLVALHLLRDALPAPGANTPSLLTPEAARLRFAGLWRRCQQLRRYNLRNAANAEAGRQVGVDASTVNIFWSKLVKDLAEFTASIHADAGVTDGTPVSEGLLYSRASSIYSGTDEIQLNIIAERVLGLPR